MKNYIIQSSPNQSGSVVKGLLTIILVLTVAVGTIAFMFGTVVPPGTVGVRQVNFGPGQGFSTEGLNPGYHWSIPFYSKIHLIPQTIQMLHLGREAPVGGSGLGSLEVQTNDGATVLVDISILVKFYSEPGFENGKRAHGGPADLIKNVGVSRTDWDNNIRRVAEDALRRSLGTLLTGQFYDPVPREKAVKAAFETINQTLPEFGIRAEALLLRRYTYAAEQINEAIFKKNLQAQEERLNAGASKLAEARATLEQVSAEWDAKIETLKVEGENKSRVTRSEGGLYESERVAQGDLALAKARAEVDRLKSGALAQSRGAEVYVARELAPILGSLKGGVVADVDPYDLDNWSRRLGVGGPRQ